MTLTNHENLHVVYLAAGAAGMYCGSCIRDNRLAATLLRQGRSVTLIPLYTPLRTDEHDVSRREVFYGGLNVYLEHRFRFFRRLPRGLTRLLDAPGLLGLVGRFAAKTRPEDVADLTIDVLRGEHGPQRVELERLIDALRPLKPSLVNLPNLMFLGVARALKEALDVPIVCTLSGEDIFLDRLPEPQRTQAFDLIRAAAGGIDAFISVTEYFAHFATEHFGLPGDRVHVVPLGLDVEDFAEPAQPAKEDQQAQDVFTIGYLARICPDKGLANLAEAFIRLAATGRKCRLRVAGYLSSADQPYLKKIESRIVSAGLAGSFEHVGEVDRQGKIDFLRSLDVLSVPTIYHEAKGLYVLEALAAGVPVVQPRHGSFPELIEATGGGILYEPGNTDALVDALAQLMDDSTLRQSLASQGREAVHRDFTGEHMADRTWDIYTKVCRANQRA